MQHGCRVGTGDLVPDGEVARHLGCQRIARFDLKDLIDEIVPGGGAVAADASVDRVALVVEVASEGCGFEGVGVGSVVVVVAPHSGSGIHVVVHLTDSGEAIFINDKINDNIHFEG